MHQINHLNLKQKNQVEINDESRGVYNANSQTKFKTAMLKCSLWDSRDAYILVKGTMTGDDTSAAGAAANNNNKKVKLCTIYQVHKRNK